MEELRVFYALSTYGRGFVNLDELDHIMGLYVIEADFGRKTLEKLLLVGYMARDPMGFSCTSKSEALFNALWQYNDCTRRFAKSILLTHLGELLGEERKKEISKEFERNVECIMENQPELLEEFEREMAGAEERLNREPDYIF